MIAHPSDGDTCATLMSFDPGTDTFGVAYFSFDVRTLEIIGCWAETLSGERLSRHDVWMKELHGDRYARIWALEQELDNRLNATKPLVIASEAPFVKKRFPQAGLALTEVICSIRAAVRRYDIWKPLYLIEPTAAKKAVGMVGTGKKAVNDALLKLSDLHYSGTVPLNQLDEHSTDALAVGYCQLKLLRSRKR